MAKIKMIEKATRMHLGRCKNCGSGWTKTNYLDELDPDVLKYFKDKGFADNADICPKCVADVKDYLGKNTVAEAGAKVVSRFTISDPDLDIDGQTIEEVLDKRFPMGDVFVRIIGRTKCEFRIEGEILKAIDIHWIERTIGGISALEVNCKE